MVQMGFLFDKNRYRWGGGGIGKKIGGEGGIGAHRGVFWDKNWSKQVAFLVERKSGRAFGH